MTDTEGWPWEQDDPAAFEDWFLSDDSDDTQRETQFDSNDDDELRNYVGERDEEPEPLIIRRGESHRTARMRPNPTFLYHVTSMVGLEGIVEHGAVLARCDLPEGTPSVGMQRLIRERARTSIELGDGAIRAMNEFVGFYFTPLTPMMRAITGHKRPTPTRPQDLVILRTSIDALNPDLGTGDFAFTDGHGSSSNFPTRSYIDLDDLGVLDWDAIRAPTWSDSSGKVDTEKRWRRSAEFLVWWRVNLSRIDTIACNDDVTRERVVALLSGRDLTVRISKQSFFMRPQRG